MNGCGRWSWLGGGLLIAALVVFLAVGRWKSHFNLREIPKRLGANIQQEANGVTYTQAHGGHTLFKIHASKVVQLKQGGRAILHDVQIELYGEDGARVDRIAGDEFEYDQKNGIATAAGPVEITLMRPAEALGRCRPRADSRASAPEHCSRHRRQTRAAQKASQGEIHVKTSGLIFDQKSGIATTAQRVEFAIAQGTGSSLGATFDSENGQLVLDHAVELDVRRGPQKGRSSTPGTPSSSATISCAAWRAPQGNFRGGAGHCRTGRTSVSCGWLGSSARCHQRLFAHNATAARIAAPRGTLDFDEHNQPRHGRLEGGATMDSSSNGRQVHGSAPTADLAFTPAGVLQHAHLERGVVIHSEESSTAQNGEPLKVSRDWRSPVADVAFRSAEKGRWNWPRSPAPAVSRSPARPSAETAPSFLRAWPPTR